MAAIEILNPWNTTLVNGQSTFVVVGDWLVYFCLRAGVRMVACNPARSEAGDWLVSFCFHQKSEKLGLRHKQLFAASQLT